jgi:hypothetical protein
MLKLESCIYSPRLRSSNPKVRFHPNGYKDMTILDWEGKIAGQIKYGQSTPEGFFKGCSLIKVSQTTPHSQRSALLNVAR